MLENVRLDGRTLVDSRTMAVALSRGECSSTAEVTLGDTRVIAVVQGEIVSPFPDRPMEGSIQFSADVSVLSDVDSLNSSSEICRLLERSIRDSEAIDMESLCIIAGDKVWNIKCDVRIMDFSGGNLVDTSLFAAMSALRAFRKPEISVVSLGAGSFSGRNISQIKTYSSEEREPLQLALHHIPLSVNIALFKLNIDSDSSRSSSAGKSKASIHLH